MSSPVAATSPSSSTASTLTCRFRTSSGGSLLEFSSPDGQLCGVLEISRGRLRATFGDLQLHMVDGGDLDDGCWHSLALTSDHNGTQVSLDGYYLGAMTWQLAETSFPAAVITAAPCVTDLQTHAELLSIHEIARSGQRPEPLVTFVAPYLSPRDLTRVGELATGTLALRFRTRGAYQSGTILHAEGERGSLRLSVTHAGLDLAVIIDGTVVVAEQLAGSFDTGRWHWCALTADHGSLRIHIDGSQALVLPGALFFATLGALSALTIGQDSAGNRLFGEVHECAIYSRPLSVQQHQLIADAQPLRTVALFDSGMAGAANYRIPAVWTTRAGTVIATCDQRGSSPNDAPNDISLVLRRSTDGGASFSELQTVIAARGSGLEASCVIDSVLLEDEQSGTLLCVVDAFPAGIGQFNSDCGSGYDSAGRRVLIDAQGQRYCLAQPGDLWEGPVLTADGEPTDYELLSTGEVRYQGEVIGSVFTREDPAHPYLLQPFPSSSLLLLRSEDDGLTWSAPVDLNAQVKQEWMGFLGTGPGRGIQLRGKAHTGRLLVPVYLRGGEATDFRAAVIYSDDGGQHWQLSGSVGYADRSAQSPATVASALYENAVVELNDGRVLMVMRNQHPSGRVAVSYSADGGLTWTVPEYHPQLPEVFSQPATLGITAEDGTHRVLFANATALNPYRGTGVLRMSRDDGTHFHHNRTLFPYHYVYQSVTQLPSGDLGVLWEMEWEGLFFTVVPVSWLESSRLGSGWD